MLSHLQPTPPSLLFQRNLELSKERHESKVRKNPREGNRKTQEGTKLCKELQLTEEERNTRNNTGNHSVEHTDSQVPKRFRNPLVCVA
mmetsp:Transcript_7862/g.13385  ORF Transcript_7862/g.13385 Transcript_7862/m.13385 type:complete len:88 (+) Transcript_7862:191-454(+)